MNGFFGLAAAYTLVWRGRLVLNLLTERQCIFVGGRRGVDRIRHAIVLGFTEVIDQQISGDRGHPGHESSLGVVIARESAVHLDEDLLGKVFSVVRRTREAVADVVDTPVVGLDDLLPSRGIAGDTAPDQHRNYLDVFQTKAPGKSETC